MARDPGAKAVYGSAQINLLGGVVTNATRTWLPDFLHENFAAPLDIHRYHLNMTPLGNGYMGGGIYMRPRDFMKLGQVFLAGGKWNGRQIVSKEWVERATHPHAGIHGKDDYGYAWWMRSYHVGSKTYRAFYASGNGGQSVIVIPELDLVVMFTAGNYGNFPTWRKFGDELVPTYIIPATTGS
jgi:CubicO group peptidase (beta-lactamase class C family)